MAAVSSSSRLLILLTLLSGISGVSAAQEVTLIPQQPIEQADASLQRDGWQPVKGLAPEPMDRQLAGNRLPSLSACSGTGQGFCRYDYQRGVETLAVITVPGPQAQGLVLQWFRGR
ncbi:MULTISPECIES: hypothetical protein [unclassified Synechococcus]|uniref:hypothetical protein n=1 Tax=unclassified Synechococcus TaxID=2626047 RepID=UPI002001574B|nr:hypothetical protein [Synechococcus sp. A10-1-5-1]UPM50741.1 hypothetical protein MY494_02835 [Synechococcus sp. A10-1-5-1]